MRPCLAWLLAAGDNDPVGVAHLFQNPDGDVVPGVLEHGLGANVKGRALKARDSRVGVHELDWRASEPALGDPVVGAHDQHAAARQELVEAQGLAVLHEVVGALVDGYPDGQGL